MRAVKRFFNLLTSTSLLTCVFLFSLSPSYSSTPPHIPYTETESRGAQRVILRNPPRLVLLMVFDQMRSDYLTRFSSFFLPPLDEHGKPGGFRYLMEEGAFFPNAFHRHFPLFTAPGHAAIITGGFPYRTGMVANEWYSTADRKVVYCVEDPHYSLVGGEERQREGTSPANLASTTLGDELRLSNTLHSKVIALSIKDRTAILLGGHLANGAFWMDGKTGRWMSSTFYAKEKELPPWVREVNSNTNAQKWFGGTWNLLLPEEAYVISRKGSFAYADNFRGMGKDFPHPLTGGADSPGEKFYDALATSPYGNEITISLAKEAMAHEELGKDSYPDLLAINFSTTDFVGHAFGPYSQEIQDLYIRLDRQLSELFRSVEEAIPGGLSQALFVATADHGASPIPEHLQEFGIDAGRPATSLLKEKVERALQEAFEVRDPSQGKTAEPPALSSPGKNEALPSPPRAASEEPLQTPPAMKKWVLKFHEPFLYLNHETLKHYGVGEEEAQEVAATALERAPGVFLAFPSYRIRKGLLPDTEVARAVTLGFYQGRSGDVVVVPRANYNFQFQEKKTGTSHGAPYPSDTRVPLLFAGAGVQKGFYPRNVSVVDLAPTVCTILGVQWPSACEGSVLQEIFSVHD